MRQSKKGKRKKKEERIVVDSKMVICGISKMSTEDNWLREKERKGFGFKLLAQPFVPKENQMALGKR